MTSAKTKKTKKADDLLKELMKKTPAIEKQEYISTGNPVFDLVLGGGIPRQNITRFSGLANSGKTLTMSLIAAYNVLYTPDPFQCLYINTETVSDAKSQLENLGFSMNGYEAVGLPQGKRFVYINASGEVAQDTMQNITDIINSGDLDLIVIDSLTMMTPKSIAEQDMEASSRVAANAGTNTLFLKKVTQALANSRTALLTSTQHRANLNKMGPYDSDHTKNPGGYAIGYSVRRDIEIRKSVLTVASGKATPDAITITGKMKKASGISPFVPDFEMSVVITDGILGWNYPADLLSLFRARNVITNKDGAKWAGRGAAYIKIGSENVFLGNSAAEIHGTIGAEYEKFHKYMKDNLAFFREGKAVVEEAAPAEEPVIEIENEVFEGDMENGDNS